jgi:hypothetical protein
MEEPIISTTEEGENEPQLNEDLVHRVFGHPPHCSSPGPDRQHKVCESQKIMDSITQNDFEAAFQQWQERCDRCIAAQVDYFEGDGVQT